MNLLIKLTDYFKYELRTEVNLQITLKTFRIPIKVSYDQNTFRIVPV